MTDGKHAEVTEEAGREADHPEADHRGEDHSLEAELAAESANWRWLFADQAGVAMAGPSAPEVVFLTQAAAESWLGEEFDGLSDAGIDTVTLMDGEHAVYGPMYLTPDGGGAVAEAEV